jgi:gamma-glutamyl-gamma-aminobutyraldehyde dehydrogenase
VEFPAADGDVENRPGAGDGQFDGGQAFGTVLAHRAALAELALEAGLPDGVLNVVTGTGQDAGAALALHGDVDMITFTGSGPVGRQLMRYRPTAISSVSLELGGKSPHIVFADYPDLDRAAAAVAWGIFYNQGQVCTAGSRLLVQRSIHGEFVEKVLAVARTIAPAIRSIRQRNWAR